MNQKPDDVASHEYTRTPRVKPENAYPGRCSTDPKRGHVPPTFANARVGVCHATGAPDETQKREKSQPSHPVTTHDPETAEKYPAMWSMMPACLPTVETPSHAEVLLH